MSAGRERREFEIICFAIVVRSHFHDGDRYGSLCFRLSRKSKEALKILGF